MKFQILDKFQITEAKKLWQTLEGKIDNLSLGNKWIWVETWLDNFADEVEFYFIVGVKANKPVGIALVAKELKRNLPFPVKAFHIGTQGEGLNDAISLINNTILVQQNDKKEFIKGLIKKIEENFKWEEIVFDEYNDKEVQDLASFFKNKNLKITTQNLRWFDLSLVEKGKTVLSYLSPSVKKSFKLTSEAFGEIEVEWAKNESEALDILDELIKFYEQTWQEKFGRKGIFSSVKFTSFHKQFISKSFTTNDVILFRVKSKEYGTLGCLYLLVDKKIALGTQLGFKDISDLEFEGIKKKHIKIGYLVHVLFMEECLKHGILGYNFSTGDYPYKYLLTNSDSSISTLSIRNNLKPVVRDGIFELHSKINKTKKASFFSKTISSVVARFNRA